MHQRVTSILAGVAIAVLLAIIVIVWVQVGHGAFKGKEEYNISTFDSLQSYAEMSTINSTHAQGVEVLKNSHLDDLGSHNMELVRPIKIDPPLHDHDLIFDQLHDNEDHPILRHHSGHFRHTAAEVWDPHPQYEIQAFGQVLVLELSFNYKFVSPNLQVTHVWENYTRRAMHDPNASGCFYTGKVKGEKNSDVAVSLCNGMTGYIRTSEGNYYIEPVEKFRNDSIASIMHRIKKVAHKTEAGDLDATTSTELCEVKENTTIIDDDFLIGKEEYKHFVHKRDLTQFRRSINVLFEDENIEFVPIAPKARSGNHQEFHIETLIVADKTMAQYHNTDEDLNHYILTLMSHVALLFKHATIGNPISLAVVEIVTLKETEFLSNTSDEMLKKFCNWQAQHAERTQKQYDTALLLTRESICKNLTAQVCNTLGVAEVGSMCNSNSSCAIVRDKGLSTSYIIAHELGHVLSMPHDDDDKCVKYNKGEKANIMSKVLQNDTKPWLWSACSRHFLTDFLESSKSSCLFDEPNRDIITSQFIQRLPGERFKVDRQCELEFGIGYKLCPFEIASCGSLWCTREDMEGCKTQHMPWADGTKCGESSWCHHGECIPNNRNLLEPIEGGWGPWMPWGFCSRTCGGGIKMSKRNCDSPPPANGGAYCKGKNVRYASCNYLPCDSELRDFREAQCAEFDGKTKGIPGLSDEVKWIPKYGMESSDDFCKLYCRVKHSTSYYMLKDKVTDGTKCGLNTFDICVNGICKHAGCDNRLDSPTTLDECGVCGGDNSKCEEITGTYNISAYGYTRVVRLPKGSSNLYISQRGYANTNADDNFLALVDGETGAYLLNGNFVVSQFLKEVPFGGMTITYSGSDEVAEYIKTPKNLRLAKDLVLEVLSVGRLLPPDIRYRYTIKSNEAPRYGWQVDSEHWTKCSSMCSGKKFLRPYCIELGTTQRVHENYCSDSEINNLVQQKDCNTHCQFLWNVTSRGQCSSQCGKGLRPIFYNCVKVENLYSHDQVPVNNKHCAILPKPSETEDCVGLCPSNHWEYDIWSECSATCGGGFQTRSAICLDRNNKRISNLHCNSEEKNVRQSCNSHMCPLWACDEWNQCSVSCGIGVQSRPCYCNVDGHIHNISACDPNDLPIVGSEKVRLQHSQKALTIEKECSQRPCVFWSADAWGECNVTCGEGRQKREVHCHVVDSGPIDDGFCDYLLKPNVTKSCFKSKCEEYFPHRGNDYENFLNFPSRDSLGYKWVTAAWSKCTKNCGNGTKSRMVVCRNKYGAEDVSECDPREVPVNVVPCNVHPCPKWNFGGWSECDLKCLQHRQVSCQISTGDIVEDDQCDLKQKPHKSSVCNSVHCIRTVVNDERDYYIVSNRKPSPEKRYKWKFERWGGCSNACGKGTRTRIIRCIDMVNAVTVVDEFCGRLKKPKTTRDCERTNCNYVWLEGVWSQCSQTCGEGFKHRNVTCHEVLKGGLVDPTPLPDLYPHIRSHYCELHSRPATKQRCLDNNCDDVYSWSVGKWSECSHPCGKKGRQIRNLYCVSRDGKRIKPGACSKTLKPRKKRKCNKHICLYRNCKEIKHYQRTSANKDYYITINNRTAQIYCYKMDTPEPEEFISLKFEQENFAEMYDRSLNDRDSCPPIDDCDCIPLGHDRAGYTSFWKVRLNITSLQIIADDFTFSRQNGKKIPYGTAGDCFSEREGCVRGRFSINLTDTSFTLAESVRWIHNGHKASAQIRTKERGVTGLCGGFCGTCLPDPGIGLQLEIR